ncbi:MAG: hypothetical protein QXS20_02930 [Candidatus Thorarchaeota archaeon]
MREAMITYPGITRVLLCNREGIVITAIHRDTEIDPRPIATVSAATAWAASSLLLHLGKKGPNHILLVNHQESLVVLLEPDCYLVFLLDTRASPPGVEMMSYVARLHTLAERVQEIVCSQIGPVQRDLATLISQRIPEAEHVMVLTADGLPLSSLNLPDDIEVAALAGSAFANGITFSEQTDHLIMGSENMTVLVARLDSSRLLLVAGAGLGRPGVIQRTLMIARGESV